MLLSIRYRFDQGRDFGGEGVGLGVACGVQPPDLAVAFGGLVELDGDDH